MGYAALIFASLLAQSGGETVLPSGDVVIPNGVRADFIPQVPGYHARGEVASRWMSRANAIAFGGEAFDGESGVPWLILIGPGDATRQAEQQIPEEIRTKIEVARYEPDDPRLDRGFRKYYQGGLTGVLLSGSRDVVLSGLFDLAEFVLRIRRLLGMEPDPILPPLFPDPDSPDGGTMSALLSWLVSAIGPGWSMAVLFLAGLLGRPWLEERFPAMFALFSRKGSKPDGGSRPNP